MVANTAGGGVTAVAVAGTDGQRTRWVTTGQCFSTCAGRSVTVEASVRATYFGAAHARHVRVGGDVGSEGAGFSCPADADSVVAFGTGTTGN